MSDRDILFSLALLAVWAAFHSLTIADWFKDWARQWLGRFSPYYRLVYNLSSMATFGVVWLILPSGGEPAWSVSGLAWWAFRGIQALGLAFFFWTFRYFSMSDFLGLSGEFEDRHSGLADLPGGGAHELAESGPYGVCRHPMYLAGVVILGFEPYMTWARLILFAWAVLYFYLGSVHEERRLGREFGPRYSAYQARVSRIIPFRYLMALIGK